MVEGYKKSRSLARKKYTSPSGIRRVRYERKRSDPAVCGMCGAHLLGVPRDAVLLGKTQRRPERPYGGVFCSPCTREVLQKKAAILRSPVTNDFGDLGDASSESSSAVSEGSDA